VYHPLSWTGRLLELPFLKFVGRISYSLYLWQQLFFLLGHQPAIWPLSALQSSPFSYFAAFALAWASYEFVERPIIRLGHKFAAH
jgi:peptidoglycan/LPS O-acetylase OafA/YrhL